MTAIPAWSDTDPIFAARKAAEDLTAATRALSDARQAKDRIAALTKTVRAYEDGLKAMRVSLRKVAIREQALMLDFEARRDQLAQLLGVLQSLERASTPLLLIHPSGPMGTARSGQILTEVTPAIHSQAEELRAQLQELHILRALQISAEDDLKSGLKGVQDARIDLTNALSERTNLPRRFVAEPGTLETLARNSNTLTGFSEGLADLPFDDDGSSEPDFSAAKGSLPLPVFGTLLRGFNESDAAGLRRPGILLSAPPVSLVTAPWPATIRYLGPLLDYGNVIILEPASGFLIVFAGLGQVYGKVGQVLSAGEPVGLLAGSDPQARDFLIEASAEPANSENRQETLYIEIREDKETVDPAKWFMLTNR